MNRYKGHSCYDVVHVYVLDCITPTIAHAIKYTKRVLRLHQVHGSRGNHGNTFFFLNDQLRVFEGTPYEAA